MKRCKDNLDTSRSRSVGPVGWFSWPYLVGDVHIAAGLAEGHHDGHAAVLAGHVEGGVAVPVLEIDEASLAEESLDDLHLTPPHSEMQSDVSVLQQTPGAMSTSTWTRGPGLALPATPGLGLTGKGFLLQRLKEDQKAHILLLGVGERLHTVHSEESDSADHQAWPVQSGGKTGCCFLSLTVQDLSERHSHGLFFQVVENTFKNICSAIFTPEAEKVMRRDLLQGCHMFEKQRQRAYSLSPIQDQPEDSFHLL